jgi:hypothetical protein
MKILIVNGYSSNYNGNKRFEEFVTCVKDVWNYHKRGFILDILKTQTINGFNAWGGHQR